MRKFALLMLVSAPFLFVACSSDTSQTTATSTSTSSSSGTVGPCNPWGTWKLQYDDANDACALGSDTVTITQNADGSANVAFAGDDTMPMSMCSPNPEPGTYSTTASVTPDGCALDLASNLSYCYSGENQCESRKIKLLITGDAMAGTLLHDVCWCTMGDPMPISASGQRMP